METLYVRKYMTDNNDLFIEGPASDPTATALLIDELNEKAGREVFGLCLDTGHMHIVRKDARTYIPILGKPTQIRSAVSPWHFQRVPFRLPQKHFAVNTA